MTNFTHEGLLERGFSFENEVATRWIDDMCQFQVGVDTESCWIGCDGLALETTITTLEDLDTLLGFLKQ